ncbi:hypothetical protein C476_11624 [Natrinema limicola JCM 13563]|uniref:Uncharacterized protein n=2 Tax=Natrinema TaxID=88723 RepID=M0CB31_9EURY|nr:MULTISPECIES: hypothetical protein [Natrinema]ELZ19848.1 hypothetical protein C476_11624 [Natrinema limicola JCM 13563]
MVPMTSSTASTRNGGLLETPFSMGATAVAAVTALLSVFIAWTGYNDGVFPVIGYQLDILTGAVALVFGLTLALVALTAAAYMEPGFGE